MVKYIVQPEDGIGRMEWHRAYVKYMIRKLEDEDCNVTIRMESIQDAEVLENPPEGNITIEAEWGGHYTANKMIGACRGLYELGYFDFKTEAIVYVMYGCSAMSYIDYISVFYKKGKIRKHKLPKMQYYAAGMFMWGYDNEDLKLYDLKKFKDLIEIDKKKEGGIMITY